MELYLLFLYSSSVLGFLIIFVSLYLLIAVPTKLTTIARFAIHGHDFMGAIAQLFLTLGLQPYLILPCTSMYFVGVFTSFRIMSTLTQMWLQIALVAVNATFSLLITINRALAVSVRMSDRSKKLILQLFFAQLIVQLFLIAVIGVTIEDHNEEGRKICLKKIKVYPKEMDTMNGVNLILTADIAMITTMIYVVLLTFLYMLVTSVSIIVLLQSIREQAKSSQSAQFLANQRRLTVGVFSFMMAELIGLAIPIICLNTCAIFQTGNVVVFQFAMISLCLYPAFGSYYVLMSNTDYRNRIHSIFRRARKVTSLNREQTVATTL